MSQKSRPNLKEAAEAAREKMVEAIANHDDEVATKYLEGCSDLD